MNRLFQIRLIGLSFFAAVALIGLLGSGCRKQAGGPAGMQRPPASVTVSQPIEKEIVEWDTFPGRLEAMDMVEVRSRVSGYLESVHFKDGAEVKKGDLLFIIDPRQYRMDLARAEADLHMAETRMELASNDLARAERLLKSKAISEEEADMRNKAQREAASAVQMAHASMDMAKLNTEYTHITSPIDGRIGRKLITEGNLVNGNQGQSTLLATIVSMDPIYCYFDADEPAVLKYLQLERDGKSENLRDGKVVCELELANETGFPHKGVLDFLDNRVDAATGTLRVRGLFPNPGPGRLLQPGFFSRIRVPGSGRYKALLIPDVAIGMDQGQRMVYVVNDKNIVEYRAVKLGPIVEGLRVVREGLKPGEWVIVNGLMTTGPGAPVNPTKVEIKPVAAPAAKPE